MAAEVPFHSGFLSEAEAEARTAICTKLSLEQLDQEPFFRARLWWLRARKFVADRIAGDEDIEDDVPRYKKGTNSYFAFVCILVLALYCGVSIVKHGLDNPLLSVRDGIIASLRLQDTAVGKLQRSQDASISASISTVHVSPAPIIFPGSQPGWCHTIKLWSQKPSCGPFRGIWDSATPSRTFEHDDLAWAEGAYARKRTAPEVQALDAKVQSVVEMLHSALPQQDKVNALFYHLLGELKSELSSLRVHQAAPGPATQHEAAPQPTQMPSQYLVIAACAVLVMASMIHSHRQNKAHNATQGLILAQLAAAAAQAEAAQRAVEEVQRSQRRMERAADDARADTLQMHEALRDSLATLAPRIDRLDAVDASISQLASSMGAVSVEVLSWAHEGRADLAKARRELDSAAAERESLLGEIEEREAAGDAQAARVQELTGELQAAQAQAARLAASLEAGALLQTQLQEALLGTEEELAEQEEAVKRTAAEALEREAKLAEAEGFCALLRQENEHLQQTAEELEAALEKTQQWVSEDEVLRGALEAELAEAQAAQADLQQRLQAAEEQARAAAAEAERQRKAAVEKDKLLHYKKYELECMKKAVEQLQQETEGGLASMASSPLPVLS